MARHPGRDARARYLRVAILAFIALLAVAAVALPPIISGYTLTDPVIISTLVGIPALLVWYRRLNEGDFEGAALGFVWTSFVLAWIFTIAIQGSGYLVGNYAYLTTIVLLAAFFLDTRQTMACAGANLLGVLVIHNVWGLALRDLALSVAYIVIFSTLLILIARLMENDQRTLERKSRELLRSNQGLARASAERQALLDHTQDGIIHADMEGRLRSMNRRAATLFQEIWDAVPRPDDDLASLAPLQQRPLIRLAMKEAAAGRPVERTLTVSDRHLRLRLQRLQGPAGEGLVLFVADMTAEVQRQEAEREQLEQRLEMEKLAEMNRMQRNFINIASHELQTPLTPLRLQLHVLRERRTGPLNDDQLRAVEIIERNTVRLGRLVEEIMDVVRIDNERVALDLGDVELVSLTQEHLDSLAPLLEKRAIECHVRAPKTAWVRADAHRLGQVIGNLLANAAKFTEIGGNIRVVLEDGDQVSWSVTDDGIGIAEEDLDRLFQPFSQVHDKPGEFGGTGLGLAISKGFIEAQGGRITAESEGPGRGATFRFVLPRASHSVEQRL